MAGFYEKFLERDVAGLDIDAAVSRWPSWGEVEADIRRVMSGPLVDKGINETREKYVDAAGIRARIEKLVRAWPQLRAKLAAQLMPAKQLQLALASAGAPSVPSDIGLSALRFRVRCTTGRVTRSSTWPANWAGSRRSSTTSSPREGCGSKRAAAMSGLPR